MVSVLQSSTTSDVDDLGYFDVLIVGAGISGIGGGYHLQQQLPDKSFIILEAQDGFGGTWRTHKYPGIRSDSDLFTFGYRFKPWTGAPIATADLITEYMSEVIEENGLEEHIRYSHTVESAAWSTEDKRWTLTARQTQTDTVVQVQCGFLWMCQGYYRHSEGYTPTWDGMDEYEGLIVHPQRWPEDLDYSDKKVVVIGSGATAATLIPAMAPTVEHITMLQRSPTFFSTGRNANELADLLRELDIDPMWIHEIVRRKVLYDQRLIDLTSRQDPEVVREELFGRIRAVMGDDYELAPHFTPSYRPWQQRIAFVPDADLFEAIKSGQASVVTDHIDRFTPKGIQLTSGEHLDADIIVTATGFNLNVLGDIAFDVDGEPLDFSSTVTYHGTMFTGVPNMAWVFGYFRASWTLRADLIADFVCRLLAHMDELGVDMVVPVIPDEDQNMAFGPWVDPDNFNPGYLTRGLHLLPRQGDKPPWLHTQDYWSEKDIMPEVDLDDGTLVYE